MASNKGQVKMVGDEARGTAAKKQTASTAAADVNDFASSYLGSGQKQIEGSQGQTTKEKRLPVPLPQIARNLHSQYQVCNVRYMLQYILLC